MRPRGSVHQLETAIPLCGIDQEAAAPHAKTGCYIVVDSIAHSYTLFLHEADGHPRACSCISRPRRAREASRADRSLTLRLSRCYEAAKTAIMS